MAELENGLSEVNWVVPTDNERTGFSGSNEWFMYRNRVNLKGSETGTWRLAADSKYWLYVNGQMVVREGSLKRGPTPDGCYFEAVDVARYLRQGTNTIAVLLWYFGRHGFSHRDSGLPGLLFDAGGGVLGNWKVKRHPAYFDAGYMHDAYRLSENSIGFDARRDFPEWVQENHDDGHWPEATVGGKAGSAPWGGMERREFGQWFWSERREFEEIRCVKSPGLAGSRQYMCRLPYNAQFIPILELEAKSGIRIEIKVLQDTNRLCAVYITKAGRQSHEFEGWMSGEEVVFTVPSDGVEIRGLYYRETGFPSRFEGAVTCDDPHLSTLWEKARRTLYVTMRDTFMDCPCRERAQWPGDLVVQLGQVPYCLDRNADPLVKKGLRETLRWQRPDGVLYGPVPEGNWRMELPAQMLAVLSPFGIWTYYLHSGDRGTLEEVYPHAKRYFDVWKFQENGLVQYRPDRKGSIPEIVNGVSVGTWDWIDWGERIDAEPALNAWFFLAAEGLSRAAHELGREEDVALIREKQQQVRTAIRNVFLNGENGAFVSEDFNQAPDDRVQALMVLGGIADPEDYHSLRKIFETVHNASPYMEYYVLAALIRMGETNLALARMCKRFQGMIENDHSTLWERWPEWHEDKGEEGTINHSWSGGPLTLLSAEIAGLAPVEPGWKVFKVEPKPGKLNKVSGTVLRPEGYIQIHAKLSDGVWHVALEVPEGLVAKPDFGQLGEGPAPEFIPAGRWQGTFSAGDGGNE